MLWALAAVMAHGTAASDSLPSPGVDYAAVVERFARSEGEVPDWPLTTLEWLAPRVRFALAASSEPLRRAAVELHLTAATRASLLGQLAVWKAHLALARALLPLAAPQGDLLHAAPERVALRRAVPLVEAYDLLRRHRPLDALAVLQPIAAADDPHWLLAVGMSQELLGASPQLLAAEAAADPGAAAVLEKRRELVGRGDALRLERRERLLSAERSLRAAAELAPGLQEARLRLGRVRALLGKRVEAEADWRRVLGESGDPEMGCLARLFLGRSAIERRAWGEATVLHREGVAACPESQALRLALASSLAAGGERAAAREQARAAAALETDAVDPWLRYNAEPQRGIARLLAELRRR